MTDTSHKQRAREYMAEHGVKYTEALRAVQAATDASTQFPLPLAELRRRWDTEMNDGLRPYSTFGDPDRLKPAPYFNLLVDMPLQEVPAAIRTLARCLQYGAVFTEETWRNDSAAVSDDRDGSELDTAAVVRLDEYGLLNWEPTRRNTFEMTINEAGRQVLVDVGLGSLVTAWRLHCVTAEDRVDRGRSVDGRRALTSGVVVTCGCGETVEAIGQARAELRWCEHLWAVQEAAWTAVDERLDAEEALRNVARSARASAPPAN